MTLLRVIGIMILGIVAWEIGINLGEKMFKPTPKLECMRTYYNGVDVQICSPKVKCRYSQESDDTTLRSCQLVQ